jgi:NDP-sugar pyrophosphorylase family protein
MIKNRSVMSKKSPYRALASDEITILEACNCTSDNWADVNVKDGFDPKGCRNVNFSGSIRLGLFSGNFVDDSGVTIGSGITNAHLHNCTVGDNVSIYNVRDYIANYIIEDEVVIRNCGKIHTENITAFGNGTSVAVLNETGARAVKIWDRLTAHQAYIIALYRHRASAIKKIDRMTDSYVAGVSSGTGRIGRKASIMNCSHIRNVSIGPSAVIDGAARLSEGSVNSCAEDPVFIGPGVIMDHFIVCSGSTVTDSAIIDKCFIGQGCIVLCKLRWISRGGLFDICRTLHGNPS